MSGSRLSDTTRVGKHNAAPKMFLRIVYYAITKLYRCSKVFCICAFEFCEEGHP